MQETEKFGLLSTEELEVISKNEITDVETLEAASASAGAAAIGCAVAASFAA